LSSEIYSIAYFRFAEFSSFTNSSELIEKLRKGKGIKYVWEGGEAAVNVITDDYYENL
jgi:hypothetical protein